MWLDRTTLHQHNPQLGLQAKTSPPVYAGLCQKSIEAIPPWNETSAAFPVPMCTNKIRGHQTIRNAGINSTTPWCTGERFHSTTMWQVPLPGQSNRQYPVMPNQCTGVTIIQSYQRHNAMCHTITWLSGHTGRSNTNIQCKRYDLSCAQWCKLPQQTQARSRAGGHFFLSSDTQLLANNGAILDIAHIIKTVMSLATEAELAALFIMAWEAVYIRIILKEMGHKQRPTPMQTDNAMADGIINSKVQLKRTRAMDMQFHWLWDRECQQQFRIYWRPGKLNYADYWTKHHPTEHHWNIRKEFLTPHTVLAMLRIEQGVAAKAA